jgi:hypothetical protein
MPTLSRATHWSIAALVLALAPAGASAKKAPTTASKSVVLAPVSSLSASKPKALVAIEKTIEQGLASIPKLKVVTARSAVQMANTAKKPELRSCEGEPVCLAQLGTLAGTQYVVYAEVGGLGESQVIYLKLIDVAQGKEIRSTLIEVSSNSDTKTASNAAATRLLVPEKYVGSLVVKAKVKGAIVYVDGQKRGTTPAKAISGSVGSHAIRITHPEHRDYVRFVDLQFGKQTEIKVELKMLPGVSKRLALEGVIGGGGGGGNVNTAAGETPWYLRWYSIGGGLTLIGVSSAIILSTFGGIDYDDQKFL